MIDIDKGFQLTGYPQNIENGAWVHAVNLQISNDGKSVYNENGQLLISKATDDDNEFIIGAIETDIGAYIFYQQYDAQTPYNVTHKFIIRFFNYEDNTLTTKLATSYIAYSPNSTNTDNARIFGAYIYNKNKETILAWWGGVRIREGINTETNNNPTDRKLCIYNVDTVPFRNGLDGSNEIILSDLSFKRDFTLLFQNTEILNPHINLVDILDNGGNLKTGTYFVSIRYKYPDKDYTNTLNFSRPIVIMQGGVSDSFNSVDGGTTNGGETTGKAIKLNIDNIDGKFKTFQVVVYAIIQGTPMAWYGATYETNNDSTTFTTSTTTGLSNLSKEIVISGVNLQSTTVDSVLLDTIFIDNVKTGRVFEDRLILGNIKYPIDYNWQKWALGITTAPYYEDVVALENVRGSYKSEVVIYNKTGFMPGEVYAFYAALRYTNGSLGSLFHIPGRAPELFRASQSSTLMENWYITDNEVLNINERYNLESFSANIDNYARLHNLVDGEQAGVNKMAYWENENELYPNTDDFVNNALSLDLRKHKVRHHKFPTLNTLLIEDGINKYIGGKEMVGENTATIPSVDITLALTHNTSNSIVRTSLYKQNSSPNHRNGFINCLYSTSSNVNSYFTYGQSLRTFYGYKDSNGFMHHIDSITPVPAAGVVDCCDVDTANWTKYGSSSDYNDLDYYYIKAKKDLLVSIPTINIGSDIDIDCGVTLADSFYSGIQLDIFKDPTNRSNYDVHSVCATQVTGIVNRIFHDGNASTSSLQGVPAHYKTNWNNITGSVTEFVLLEGESLWFRLAGAIRLDNQDVNASDLDDAMSDYLATNQNITIRIKDISGLNYNGNKFGKILGVKFNNIYIPDEIKDKVQGVEFFYAKRDFSQVTKLGNVMVSKHGNDIAALQGNLDNDLRFEVFDLFQNGRKQLPITYIDIHTINNNNDIELTSSSSLTTVGEWCPILIKNNKFLKENNNRSIPDNTHTEEHIYANKIDEVYLNTGLIHDIKTLSIGNVSLYKQNMYNPYYEQTPVSLGEMLPINSNTLSYHSTYNVWYYIKSINPMYGGDTYFSLDHQFVVYDDTGSSGNLMFKTLIFPTYSQSNIGLQYGNDLDNLYLPKNTLSNIWNYCSDISINATSYQKKWAYNSNYSRLLDFKNSFIYNYNNRYINEFPNRIIRSMPQYIEYSPLMWRNFLTNDYHETNKDKGEIIAFGKYANKLLIHQRNSLYVATIKDVLRNINNTDIYLGKGDLFDREPTELLPTATGYLGLSTENVAIDTLIGHIFIDNIRRNLYIYNNELKELSNVHLKELLDKVLISDKNDVLINDGIVLGFDEDKKVIYITVQNTNTNTPFSLYNTISFNYKFNKWQSYHTTNPSFYIIGRNKLYGIKNTYIENTGIVTPDNNIYKFNKGEIGFYDTVINDMYQPFIVDVMFNVQNDVLKIFESIEWIDNIMTNMLDNYNTTFDRIMIYNDTQCTDIIDLNNNTNWFNTEHGRQVDGIWKFNKLEDAVIDNTNEFLSTFKSLISSNVNSNIKNWFDVSKFTGTFIVIRFINTNQKDVTNIKKQLNKLNVNYRHNYR